MKEISIMSILTKHIKVSENGFSGEQSICGLFTAEKVLREYVIKARIEEISNCAIGEIGQDFSERIAELKEELK